MNTQPDVFSPAKLGPLTLRNRIIKAATFEAASPDALVTDDLINYHRRPAAGGVGMTTVAYCAVSPGGRTDGWQIWMRPEAVPGLRRLTDAVHAEGAAISAQIGHAGPVANSRTNKAPALAPVRFFNPLSMRFARKATRDDIREVTDAHANAARHNAALVDTDTHADIEQRLHFADDMGHKNRLLDHLLRDVEMNQAIVFTATKRAADEHLLGLAAAPGSTLRGVVLRPSVVFGQGGASTALFMRLARLPLLVLPGPVLTARIQPLAVQDLADAVVALLGSHAVMDSVAQRVTPSCAARRNWTSPG